MKEPTIDFEDLADEARAKLGRRLERITQRDREKRSEVIEFFFSDGRSLAFSHDRPGGDPDAVRKLVRDFIAGVDREGKDGEKVKVRSP